MVEHGQIETRLNLRALLVRDCQLARFQDCQDAQGTAFGLAFGTTFGLAFFKRLLHVFVEEPLALGEHLERLSSGLTQCRANQTEV